MRPLDMWPPVPGSLLTGHRRRLGRLSIAFCRIVSRNLSQIDAFFGPGGGRLVAARPSRLQLDFRRRPVIGQNVSRYIQKAAPLPLLIENRRLKELLAESELDKRILKEALEGNY